MYESQVEKFVEEQRQLAVGQRKEMLSRKLVAEKKMLAEVLLPVLRTFDGLTMEYEMVSQTGVKMYIDVYYHPLKLAFESEGYVGHSENITRDRFDFEKVRVRSFASHAYRQVPFSWDELDKKTEACRRSVAEIIGYYSASHDSRMMDLPVYHREIIRYGARLGRPLRQRDVAFCLQLGETASARILHQMLDNQLLIPLGKGTKRHHEFVLTERALDYLLL